MSHQLEIAEAEKLSVKNCESPVQYSCRKAAATLDRIAEGHAEEQILLSKMLLRTRLRLKYRRVLLPPVLDPSHSPRAGDAAARRGWGGRGWSPTSWEVMLQLHLLAKG